MVLLSGDPKADSSTVVHRLLELRPPQEDSEATPVADVLDELHTYTRDPQSFERIGPQRFEELVANIFAQQGYELTAKGRAHDAGYDIALRSPSENKLILVQVKKLSRQARVSIAQVRELIGAASVMNADVGVLVTSTSFTAGAKALAAEVTRPKLTLVTMDRLLGSRNLQELWTGASAESAPPGSAPGDG
jgi:restriction system protein